MSKEAEKTLEYFRAIPSNDWDMDIPPAHYGSHLYNFGNPYTEDNDEFWIKVRELTEIMLLLDISKCPRLVALCGQPGSGKSHLEVGLYRAMLHKTVFAGGGGVFFSPFMTMVTDIISGFGDKVYIREALSEYTKNKWLFLDDFSATEKVFKKDSMENQIIRDLLIERWDTGQTLVTSTNLDAETLLKDIEEMFGEHIGSRVSDSIIIQFPDDDLRKQGYGGYRRADK